ncbi:hypothetical protein SUGI_0818110 [Cryptomeria japonica]|uniref:uncharacterized protein LOC131027626 n=1 Tax=Cryptomeria japonica TaxID=3369 RepID=UPI0024147EDA|nr:uncharacterized protein LOC131027626 [Cryptomeria japonica]GLJ39985.1 hypothetical protein SUGI_0818110 [Cryptomeria japonica]
MERGREVYKWLDKEVFNHQTRILSHLFPFACQFLFKTRFLRFVLQDYTSDDDDDDDDDDDEDSDENDDDSDENDENDDDSDENEEDDDDKIGFCCNVLGEATPINEIAEGYVENDCPICGESIELREVKMLRCRHVYHYECIWGWASRGNSTCPLCIRPF